MMLVQLLLSNRSDWAALITLGALNFSSALAVSRPCQEVHWMMLFGFVVTIKGEVELGRQYVLRAENALHTIEDRCAAADPTLDSSSVQLPDVLPIRQIHARYLFGVGAWAASEAICRQVHNGYEERDLLCTPGAYLNAAILTAVLYIQGKRAEYVEALRQEFEIARDSDSGYRWGRHPACDLAAASAQNMNEEETKSWYQIAIETSERDSKRGITNFYFQFIELCYLLHVEVIKLQMAQTEEEQLHWGSRASDTARKVLSRICDPAMSAKVNLSALREFDKTSEC
ncbi:hypothetical protein HK104_003227 [Borealophlyctis nickersoniae]|nr:hypothetical protein HK104_003227 [Borealophlyctis nickersoniae]